jgi:ribosomal protein S18 acetylase RimI-like enzyme
MPGFRSLVWATDVDVLPVDRVLSRRSDHWVVRDPGNPGYHWGNALIFDLPPRSEDGLRWEALFDREFAAVPAIKHRTFAWDTLDGGIGAAAAEFVARGYRVESSVGLVAAPAALREHPRASRDVVVRPLDPHADVEEASWAAVRELHIAGDRQRQFDPHYRSFVRKRFEALRVLFRSGRGAWYAAFSGAMIVGSLGIVVTGGRARFQMVDTRASHRGRGVASRLVLSAAAHAVRQQPVDELVIVADPDYHARAIYESLGFKAVERVCGVVLADSGH